MKAIVLSLVTAIALACPAAPALANTRVAVHRAAVHREGAVPHRGVTRVNHAVIRERRRTGPGRVAPNRPGVYRSFQFRLQVRR
jgi:hypothetical protein